MERRLAAILVADVVDYSRLMGEDETRTLAALAELRQKLFEPVVGARGGNVIKRMGDGWIVEYPNISDATASAIEVQEGLLDHELIQLRIGVHIGDVTFQDDDIFGDGINVAARLEALAEPGQVLISDTAHQSLDGKAGENFDGGEKHQLKNIARSVAVWRWPVGSEVGVPASATPALPNKPSIAVLPFDNMSDDPEQEYFVDGITEDVITELSKFRWLTVIARNSTFVYKRQAVDVPVVAEKLGVRYLVEGSVRKMGERVRITAQLIDAPSNEHIWAERYDRQLHDIFDLQDEMTQTLVGIIEPELANRERERVRNKPTKNMNAWDFYQRGLYHRWRFTPADIKQAHQYFDQAIALDDGFAAAYAHRAWTIYVEVMMNVQKDRAAAVAVGTADARRAIALDDRDGLGYCTYGFILDAGHEFGRAVQQFSRSLELNPSFPSAYYGLGLSHFFAGLDEGLSKSLEAAEMAIRLSPNDPMMWPFLNLKGMILFQKEDYEAAQEIFLRANEIPGAMFWVPIGLAVSCWQLGEEQRARDVITAARADFPGLSVAAPATFLGPAVQHVPRYFDAMRKAGLPEE